MTCLITELHIGYFFNILLPNYGESQGEMTRLMELSHRTYQSRNWHVLVQETLSITISFEKIEVAILMNLTTDAPTEMIMEI
jgi:hypothetical protein